MALFTNEPYFFYFLLSLISCKLVFLQNQYRKSVSTRVTSFITIERYKYNKNPKKNKRFLLRDSSARSTWSESRVEEEHSWGSMIDVRPAWNSFLACSNIDTSGRPWLLIVALERMTCPCQFVGCSLFFIFRYSQTRLSDVL